MLEEDRHGFVPNLAAGNEQRCVQPSEWGPDEDLVRDGLYRTKAKAPRARIGRFVRAIRPAR